MRAEVRVVSAILGVALCSSCTGYGCDDGSAGDTTCDRVSVPVTPPTSSMLTINIVDYASLPLRAEIDAGASHASWALEVWPNCVSDGSSDCIWTSDGSALCSFACPQITAWAYDPPAGGTTCMHRIGVPIEDDGQQPGPMSLSVRVRLFTFDGKLVSDRTSDAELQELPDHRAGFFHQGTLEWNVISDVSAAIPSTTLPRCSDSM